MKRQNLVLRKIAGILPLATMVVGLTGCPDDNDSDIGESVEDTAEETGEAIEDAAEGAEEEMEDAY